jgi:hypothetical protein
MTTKTTQGRIPADLIAERPDAPFPPHRIDPMRIALNVANADYAAAVASRNFWRIIALNLGIIAVIEFVALVSR